MPSKRERESGREKIFAYISIIQFLTTHILHFVNKFFQLHPCLPYLLECVGSTPMAVAKIEHETVIQLCSIRTNQRANETQRQRHNFPFWSTQFLMTANVFCGFYLPINFYFYSRMNLCVCSVCVCNQTRYIVGR